ncbi:hypothetical protein [Pseudomonas sp. NPDC087615]|uniref:hypothetical protein n=1 Tax=Pseudomonas sp. NPDC087615 TaxID=3364443 RepID=UPI00381A52F2
MIRLESCDRTIYLDADLPGLLPMLQRILSPGIAVTQSDARPDNALLISVSIDSRLMTWTVPGDAPSYIIDQGKITFSLEDIRQRSAIYVKHADDGAAPIRLCTTDEMEWRMTISSASPADLRGMVRLVRYIFGSMLFRCGVQFLHASAVAVNGKAYLFAGNSGSGKSSLMFKCCAELGGAFISDDLVCLWVNAQNELIISGWPKRVAVGTNLIERGSPVEHRLAQLADAGTRHYKDDAPTDSWSVAERSRMRFDSAEFLDVFGFEGARCAPLSAVVLPQATPSMSAWNIKKLPPHTAYSYLKQDDSIQIRYVTDVLGLFKGMKLAHLQAPDHSVPAVHARYGPNINLAFGRFWDDLFQQTTKA